jgi:hypothetical protein
MTSGHNAPEVAPSQAAEGPDAPDVAPSPQPRAVWCDRCGEALSAFDHAACARARRLEPPRFCPYCRRRMKVQVLPTGWTAACTEHGDRRG